MFLFLAATCSKKERKRFSHIMPQRILVARGQATALSQRLDVIYCDIPQTFPMTVMGIRSLTNNNNHVIMIMYYGSDLVYYRITEQDA